MPDARTPAFAVSLALAATLLIGAPAAAAAEPTELVNPFVGTQNFGNTFPGASAPFGMVQVSPDTGGQGGYDYQQDRIHGFSQTHLSGVGCEVAGELPMMPTTGAVSSSDHNAYRSTFSHADEEATPGYYRVGLATYGITAELTATARTGWQRYTFPTTGSANVLFNTGKANQRVFDSEVHVVGDRTVEGRVRAGNFCAGKDDHTVWFTATFDRPFANYGSWRGGTLSPGNRDAAGAGGNGAWVTFDASADRDVVVKVALSYTGADGARKNMTAETGNSFDFDATRAALREAWSRELGAIAVTGGSTQRQTAFYTSLYHSLLHPNLAGDVDGRYMGFDRKVHTANGWTPYQNFSLWDTYRPQNQLLQLLRPQVARDVALSVVAAGRDGGWLPRWALVNSETNIMTGDPVTPFLVEVWSKGLLKGYEEEAYGLLRKNATVTPPAGSPYNGRSGAGWYADRGYIPSGLRLGTDCAHKGGDNDCAYPASATMEYSLADASLALMAAGLGKTADAALFSARGQWYRNLWDSGIRQFRPRNTEGTWLTPYDPVEAAHQFHEGGAHQYQWLVPQDPAGLIDLMGGRAATEERLDRFFVYPNLLTDPAGTARRDWIAKPYDYYGKPTYNPNNEPDLHSPYMYLWAGAPAKTATVVRAAMTLFTTGPDGMTGNDDLGTMSSWYVLSSIGLYPVMSGANYFAVSSPQFSSAKITIGAAEGQGGTLTVTAPGASDTNRYIQSATLNGAALDRTWVDWSAIARGGTLDFTLGTAPSDWGTAPAAAPPSVNRSTPDGRTRVDASVRPGTVAQPTGGASSTVIVDVLGQAPGNLPGNISVVVPSGWKVTGGGRFTITSNRAPVQRSFPVTVTAPAGAGLGSYPVRVTVSALGGGSVTRTATVQIKNATTCAATPGGSCALDLSAERNRDGTATVAASTQGNFDGSGWSFDAALLPAAGTVTWNGVTYATPDPQGTAANFVQARGQSLLVPTGRRSALRIVGSAHNGPAAGAVTVAYTDGTTTAADVTMGDWSGPPTTGTTAVLAMPHRIKAGQGVDGPPVTLFGVNVPLDAGKEIRSVTLPDQGKLYIYAMTLV